MRLCVLFIFIYVVILYCLLYLMAITIYINMDFQNNIASGAALKKALHPKVIKILMNLKNPSPARITRDAEQPISGSLLNRPKPVPMPEIFESCTKIIKQDITLNLSLSRMKSRRGSIKSS